WPGVELERTSLRPLRMAAAPLLRGHRTTESEEESGIRARPRHRSVDHPRAGTAHERPERRSHLARDDEVVRFAGNETRDVGVPWITHEGSPERGAARNGRAMWRNENRLSIGCR